MGTLGILLYCVILIIQPQAFVPFLIGMPVSDIIIPLTLVIGLVETWRRNRVFWLPQHTLFLIFLAFVFLSNAANGRTDVGLDQLELYLKRIAVYFMVILILNSISRLKTTIQWITLLITILAIEGIYHDQTGIGWADQPFAEGRIQWVGDWDGSNGFCLLFIIAAIFSLEFVMGPFAFGASRWFFSVAIMLLLPAIVLTNSRGGWLSLCLVLFLFFADRHKKYVVRFLIVGTVVAGLMMALAPSRMKEINTKEESARERLWSWEQGLDFLREKPAYGIGKGMYRLTTQPNLLAHNNYLQVAAEVGWIGYFIWLAIHYLCLKGCFGVQRQRGETQEQAALITFSRMMFMAMIGFCAVTFFITMELDILYVLWGLSAVVILEGQKQFPALSRSLSLTPKDIAVVMGGGIGIIGVIHLLAVVELF